MRAQPQIWVDGDVHGTNEATRYLRAELRKPENVSLAVEWPYTGAETDEETAEPLGWANSAKIVLDPEEDSITLLVSVGDPRGAYAFTVRRLPPGADDAGRLAMYVPNPTDGALHEPLTPIRPGAFLIG